MFPAFPNLRLLTIKRCENLRSLENVSELQFLWQLSIKRCPMLENIRLPAFLSDLRIGECPLLGIVESWEHFLLALYIEHSLLGQRMKEMNLERAIIYGWKELDVIIDALGKMMIDELSEVIIKILHGWKEIGV
ncbi:Fatty acyl-CoA reductase [Arachis hypogaea]|nr:Fatty acyl-CoA reductase [Arachis hypogaea]